MEMKNMTASSSIFIVLQEDYFGSSITLSNQYWIASPLFGQEINNSIIISLGTSAKAVVYTGGSYTQLPRELITPWHSEPPDISAGDVTVLITILHITFVQITSNNLSSHHAILQLCCYDEGKRNWKKKQAYISGTWNLNSYRAILQLCYYDEEKGN